MTFAVAAESDDAFIWDRITTLQAELFAAGPVEIKFGYFGREGALPSRPFIASSWITNADDLADLIERGRAGCVCGCYIQINDILKSLVVFDAGQMHLPEIRGEDRQRVKDQRAVVARDGTSFEVPR